MLEAPLPALYLLKSCSKAIMCVPQIVTYVAVEKRRSTKENKGNLWWNHDASIGADTVCYVALFNWAEKLLQRKP